MKGTMLKRSIWSLLLCMAMIVSSIYTCNNTTNAAETGKIDLGDAVWNSDKTTYQFTNVTVDFGGSDKLQKIFCISVDNGGYFVMPESYDASMFGTGRKISAVVYDAGGKADYRDDNGGDDIKAGDKVTSLTVITQGVNDENIKNFIKSLTFYRNGVSASVKQKVSVASNAAELTEEMTAMVIDGDMHYYKYEIYSSDDKTTTWYNAYNSSKSDANKYNGLRGYLATVTSENEQVYIYHNLGVKDDGKLQAWIGGARTDISKITLDNISFTDGCLDPTKDDSSDRSNLVTDWLWVCGPEAGTIFYRTGQDGTSKDGEEIAGQFHCWNNKDGNTEPNNSQHAEFKPEHLYDQEYALEYGFNKEALWNDYNPYNTARDEWGIKGCIIEYSPYSYDDGDGVKKQHEENIPVYKDEKDIYISDTTSSPTATPDTTPVVSETPETTPDVTPETTPETTPLGIFTAQDFSITLQQAESITNDDILELSKASSKDEEGLNLPVWVSEASLEKLHNMTEGGVVEIELINNAETPQTKTIKVTVTDNRTQDDITAGNLILTIDDAKKITSDDIIKETSAKSVDKDGNNVDLRVEEDDLDLLNNIDKTGTITVTLVDENGDKKDINITVVNNKSNISPTSTDNIVIGANNVFITAEDAKKIVESEDAAKLAEDIKELCGVVVTENGDNIDITSDSVLVKNINTIKAEDGTYTVVFEYKDQIVTANITVGDPGVTVTASNFDYGTGANVTPLTVETFAKYSGAKAVLANGDATDYYIEQTEIDAINKQIAAGYVGAVTISVKSRNGNASAAVLVKVNLIVGGQGTITDNNGSGGNISNDLSPVASGISLEDIIRELGVDMETAKLIKEYADANGLTLDTLKITDKGIISRRNDLDLKGSDFSRLKARAVKSTKKSIKLKWVKQTGADGYMIYSNECNHGGKIYKYKLVKTFKTKKATTWTKKKLKKGKYYKFLVVAYKNFNGKKITIAAAPTIHACTTKGKYCMAKKLSINKVGKKKSKNITIKKGKTAKIKAKEVKAVKKLKLMKHRKLAYETSDKKVATVTKKGKIKAVAKGKCNIWVYAQNGIYNTITVTVK